MKDERPPLDLEPADEEELRSAAALARALEGGADEPDLPQAALETAALLRMSAGRAELDAERRAAIRGELLAGLPAQSERRRRSALPDWARRLPRWFVLALPLAGTAAVCLMLLVKRPEPESSFSAKSVASDGHRAVANAVPAPDAPGAAPMVAPGSVEGAEPPSARDVAMAEPRATASRGKEQVAAQAESSAAAATAADERGIGALGGGAATRREAMVAARARSADSSLSGGAAPLAKQPNARAALVGLDKEVRAERTQLLARSNDAELSRAHAELDEAQSRAELERSRANLSRLLGTAGDRLDANDARQVRQDLYCRLAETALRLGEPRAALEWTRRGLDLDGPPSPFLAQLEALEGDAYEALGEPSSAAGSYMRALRVHEALLDESLDGH